MIDPGPGTSSSPTNTGRPSTNSIASGRLERVFETPANLVPKAEWSGELRRAARCVPGSERAVQPPLRRATKAVRTTAATRGWPSRLTATGCTPSSRIRSSTSRDRTTAATDGTSGSWCSTTTANSPTYGTSLAQYVYQLEPQADVAARINAHHAGRCDGDRSAAGAQHRRLRHRRDQRHGVPRPRARQPGHRRRRSAGRTGCRQQARLQDRHHRRQRRHRGRAPGGHACPRRHAGHQEVAVFIDLSANSLLPNGQAAGKVGRAWRSGHGSWAARRLMLTGNDNDYSVTQTGAGEQFDVYVDFVGNIVRCVLDDPTQCEVNPASDDLVIDAPVTLPAGFLLLPGVLHAYRASTADLAGYKEPSGTAADATDRSDARERHDGRGRTERTRSDGCTHAGEPCGQLSWRSHGNHPSARPGRRTSRHRILGRPRYERRPALDARERRDPVRLHRQPGTAGRTRLRRHPTQGAPVRRREGPPRRLSRATGDRGTGGAAVRRLPHLHRGRALLQHDAHRPRRHRHDARPRHEGRRRAHLGRRQHVQRATTSSGSIATACSPTRRCASTSRGSIRRSSTSSAAAKRCRSTCSGPDSPIA